MRSALVDPGSASVQTSAQDLAIDAPGVAGDVGVLLGEDGQTWAHQVSQAGFAIDISQ